MKTAVVTGASGFIGRKLCAALRERGVRVVAITGRSGADGPWDERLSADLAAPDSIPALAPRIPRDGAVFFHLAGKAHALAELNADPEEYFTINAEGTRRMLALARECGARRFVLASSVKAMGEGSWRVADESATCAPETPYGRSKLEAERILFSENPGIDPAALRLSMVYGGKDRGNMTRMADAVRRRRFPPFPETGNRRSMVHVDDVVAAFLLAAEHPAAAGGTFIVTDGRLYSTREIYLTILAALGRRPPGFTPPLALFRLGARCGDVLGAILRRRMPLDSDSLAKLTDSAAYSSDLIRAELGFSSRKTLSDGLADMLGELRAQG